MPSDFSVELTDSVNPKVKIATFGGELDEDAFEGLRAKLDPVLDDMETQVIIFNLHDLEFINSKGIGFFVFAYTHLAKSRRQLILADARESVMDVMSLVGLTSVIPYYETLDEALPNS
jgi:anti-sigma B factor antagonist